MAALDSEIDENAIHDVEADLVAISVKSLIPMLKNYNILYV